MFSHRGRCYSRPDTHQRRALVQLQSLEKPVDRDGERRVEHAPDRPGREPFPGEVAVAKHRVVRDFERLKVLVRLEERACCERYNDSDRERDKRAVDHEGRGQGVQEAPGYLVPFATLVLLLATQRRHTVVGV